MVSPFGRPHGEMMSDVTPIRLRSLVGRLARRLLGDPSLVHNGESVDVYPEEEWYLAVFPAQKGRPFDADNLATVSASPFLQDPAFVTARSAAESRWSGHGMRAIPWRLHVALWTAMTAARQHPSGDLVELGTGRGYMAAAICRTEPVRLSSRRLFLVDRFTTVEPSGTSPNVSGAPGPFFYTDDAAEVRRHFEQYPWVAVIEGDLPAAVEELPSTGLCWVHVDLNDSAIEVESLRRLRTRLLPGAFVLFDDTGNPGYEASAEAHRQFADEIGAPLLYLPTGQALLVVP